MIHVGSQRLKAATKNGIQQKHRSETTDTILRVTDQKMLTWAVFLDMSKAFDSINHETLILKLQDAGASNPVIQWFCSYFNDRLQVVRIHSTLSESLPINCSNPQGRKLRQLLFSIYTTLMIFLQHPRNAASRAIPFKMKDAVNAFTDFRDDLRRIRQWCSSSTFYCWTQVKLNLWCLVAGKCNSKLVTPSLTFIGRELVLQHTATKTLGWSLTLT